PNDRRLRVWPDLFRFASSITHRSSHVVDVTQVYRHFAVLINALHTHRSVSPGFTSNRTAVAATNGFSLEDVVGFAFGLHCVRDAFNSFGRWTSVRSTQPGHARERRGKLCAVVSEVGQPEPLFI